MRLPQALRFLIISFIPDIKFFNIKIYRNQLSSFLKATIMFSGVKMENHYLEIAGVLKTFTQWQALVMTHTRLW